MLCSAVDASVVPFGSIYIAIRSRSGPLKKGKWFGVPEAITDRILRGYVVREIYSPCS
jgi:hypothetical protein